MAKRLRKEKKIEIVSDVFAEVLTMKTSQHKMAQRHNVSPRVISRIIRGLRAKGYPSVAAYDAHNKSKLIGIKNKERDLLIRSAINIVKNQGKKVFVARIAKELNLSYWIVNWVWKKMRRLHAKPKKTKEKAIQQASGSYTTLDSKDNQAASTTIFTNRLPRRNQVGQKPEYSFKRF